MSDRREYEMTEADLAELLEAMKPVPYMVIGGVRPLTVQENANAAWARLGARMSFKPMTVRPLGRGGMRFFTAEPTEEPRP